MVLISRDAARADGATRRRKTERSHLHEQPDGEPSPDDGHVLSANEIEK